MRRRIATTVRRFPGSGERCEPPARAPRARFLTCSPRHFDAHYLFNPFMTYRERVNPRRARRQWERLVEALEAAGAEVSVMEASPESAALPFTADGALCYAPGRSLVLRNDGPRGVLEPSLFRAWFREHGYDVESLPPDCYLDGGNVLPVGSDDLLVGVKGGVLRKAERYLAGLLGRLAGPAVWGVSLAHERHLHLDTALAPLDGRAYLVYRGALDGDVSDAEPLAGMEPIEVGDEDARRFACNAVVVGEVVVTGRISRPLARRIEGVGYRVERLELDEFHKAGGGAKCLTLPLGPTQVQAREEVTDEK